MNVEITLKFLTIRVESECSVSVMRVESGVDDGGGVCPYILNGVR